MLWLHLKLVIHQLNLIWKKNSCLEHLAIINFKSMIHRWFLTALDFPCHYKEWKKFLHDVEKNHACCNMHPKIQHWIWNTGMQIKLNFHTKFVESIMVLWNAWQKILLLVYTRTRCGKGAVHVCFGQHVQNALGVQSVAGVSKFLTPQMQIANAVRLPAPDRMHRSTMWISVVCSWKVVHVLPFLLFQPSWMNGLKIAPWWVTQESRRTVGRTPVQF